MWAIRILIYCTKIVELKDMYSQIELIDCGCGIFTILCVSSLEFAKMDLSRN